MRMNPTEVGTVGIRLLVQQKMGRSYYEREGHKIYEVGFPVGGNAAFFVIIEGERHYFKTITQAELYLGRRSSLS